jgi:peptidoglycan/xylan/chitin deacetylase (PgdA/CDA1 family)
LKTTNHPLGQRWIILFLALCLFQSRAQEIAITFDDAPTADGPMFTGEERTRRIIAHLKNHQVKEASFFVVTGNITPSNKHRLAAYKTAGHLLGNHSHNHQWIHAMGTAKYIRDLLTADSILALLPGYTRWYRYPFLDEGRTVSSRDSIRAALKDLHLSNGYVTVDNYDWYLNHLVKTAKEKNRGINENNLRKVYIDHIFNSILFYDNIARTHLGRSPRHVLLLHENDLSALFLGDLLAHLKSNGWKVISSREAYLDPIARQVPDVLFNGQGRIAAIAREKGIPAVELVQTSEDEIYLDQMVEEMQVFE